MKQKEKFSFTTDFQLEVLRYIIRDPDGAASVTRIKPSYLSLIEHSLIAEALTKFIKKNTRVPSQPLLKEYINNLLSSKSYVDLVMKEDVPNIFKLIDNLYTQPLYDAEEIRSAIYKFSAYVELKKLTEVLDLENFSQYEEYSKKVNGIIQKAQPQVSDSPAYLVADVIDRQFHRQASPDVFPTPFRQINESTNGGGYPKGSVVVILDKAKARKTYTLVNVARGYLKMQENVLYIDTENGKREIMGRMVQSTLNKSRRDMQSGEFDKLEQRHLRKYKRLGVEFVVERISAMIDGVDDIARVIDDVEKRTGKRFRVLMVDYAAKLASRAKDKDDNDRLFNVYVELQNLALDRELLHVWTANHVTRDGSKHKATKFEENDIASAISIVRNAQAIWGLNSTEEEESNNIQRMELVVQRDGKPFARALFSNNVDNQRMTEFSKQQRELYDKEYGPKLDSELKPSSRKNPNASSTRARDNKDI